MAERVRITDVSPRDGLQNEPGVIPTSDKVRLVELLCATGVDEVEVSSFVSPKWVPQLGDAAEVFAALRGRKPAGMVFSALAPNEKGMQSLLDVNAAAATRLIDTVSFFSAASETFNKRNTNASIEESLERFRPALQLAARAGLRVRVYISCVFACPFEGEISAAQARRVIDRVVGTLVLCEARQRENDEPLFVSVDIDLGDTIGAATAGRTKQLLDALSKSGYWAEFEAWRKGSLTLHLHDTFGRAADCVKVALDMGVRSFDGSVAGLGGCPYASTPGKRAPGNISTELLVHTIHDAGYETGVNLDKLAHAAAFAREIVARSRAEAGGAGA